MVSEKDFELPSDHRNDDQLSARHFSRDAVSASPFLCPGSTQTISRALHLARLNAAWPTCDQCEWRHDTEGLAQKTVEVTERIRNYRATGIQRTEFGVRGPYLNALDRRTTSELARVFCFCLHEHATAADPIRQNEGHPPPVGIRLHSLPEKTSPSDVQLAVSEISPAVVGYDGRSSSPDIFVGVVAAVREFGLPVVDIGRCTAASIQEAARSVPGCSGAIFVTGAGSPASWTGLDVSDSAGDSIPVLWKDFGVRLHHISTEDSQKTSPDSNGSFDANDGLSQRLRQMRSETQNLSPSASGKTSHLGLLLPAPENRTRWMARLSRCSGTHHVLDFEPEYRQWLARWYPESYDIRVRVQSDDVLIQQRVGWLAERTGLQLISRPLSDDSTIPVCRMTIVIREDDRLFTLKNAAGITIASERLAAMINVAIHSQASHVTAHSDAASGRFWLADADRSASDRSTEHVRDALAVLGLTTRLMSTGRLALDS